MSGALRGLCVPAQSASCGNNGVRQDVPCSTAAEAQSKTGPIRCLSPGDLTNSAIEAIVAASLPSSYLTDTRRITHGRKDGRVR
jgi:hypothetical protein